MRLLLLAPPGAGKGTQGERLAAQFGVRHVVAGGILRGQAQAGGRLGREIGAYQARGDLIPDQIVLDALTPATRRRLDRASQGGRADDVAGVIRHRLRVFAETTGPLVPYYANRGILVAVNADQPLIQSPPTSRPSCPNSG